MKRMLMVMILFLVLFHPMFPAFAEIARPVGKAVLVCNEIDVLVALACDPGKDKTTTASLIRSRVASSEGISARWTVAETTLTYPQSFANNIKVNITTEAGGISNFYEIILFCTVEGGTCGIGY